MSTFKAETTEPDPAATSLPNDETVNKEGGDASAPTGKEGIMAAAESKDANGASKIKEEQTTEKSEAATDVKEGNSDKKAEEIGASLKKEEKIDDKGILKTAAPVEEGRKNHSKYDPSILPTTDDPSKIRAQVCNNINMLLPSTTDNVCKGRILL
jgi:lupus La protein